MHDNLAPMDQTRPDSDGPNRSSRLAQGSRVRDFATSPGATNFGAEEINDEKRKIKIKLSDVRFPAQSCSREHARIGCQLRGNFGMLQHELG